MGVPFFDLTRQHCEVGEEVRRRIEEVFASQQFVLGETVSRFEAKFAEAMGCTHAVGMSSGTDAQLALLMALGIGPGDAVLTVPFTFFATAGCVARLGAEPVFVDVCAETLHIDVERLRDYLVRSCRRGGDGILRTPSGAKLRAIIPVHLFGSVCPMDEILELAAEFGLAVVEDAAQAAGAQYPGSRGNLRAGAIAPLAYFSFFPTKNLGGAGDGGMAVCHEDSMASRLRQIRNHGMSRAYLHDEVGGNFRLDALQAAVLSAKLPHLSTWNHSRRSHAASYANLLAPAVAAGHLALPTAPYAHSRLPDHHTYHQYVIRARDRDALKSHLTSLSIGCAIYYPLPLHLQPCFAHLGGKPGDCPIAEQACQEVLALPIFPELRQDELHTVASAICGFYGL